MDNFPEQNFEYEHVEALVGAYSRVGMRATIALRVFDQEYVDIMPSNVSALPEQLRYEIDNSPIKPRHYKQTLDLCRRIIDDFKGAAGGLIDLMIHQ